MTAVHAELILLMLLITGLAVLHRPVAGLVWQVWLPEGRRDTELCALFLVATVALVLIPLVEVVVPWLNFADFTFYDEIAWPGASSGLLALWFFWRAWVDRAVDNRRVLVAMGIYRYIRHPFYTGLLFLSLAQVLLTQNWLGGAAAVLAFIAVYGLRQPVDEQRGLERYGHQYLDYMSTTGSLLPRLRRK